MELDSDTAHYCNVCLDKIDPYENPGLQCKGDDCNQSIHIRCLRRGVLPSNFIGDVFYDLYCVSCSSSNDELLVRQKLPWLATVIITLYNLREKSSGISRRGYFHWKSDISSFINNNWDHLFTKAVKRKKNWIGTISGTLSHYSGVFFKSGTAELGDQGWWKLIDNDPPEVLVEKYYKELELKKQQSKLKGKNVDSPKSESVISYEEDSSTGANHFNFKEVQLSVNIKQENQYNIEVPKSISLNNKFGDYKELELKKQQSKLKGKNVDSPKSESVISYEEDSSTGASHFNFKEVQSSVNIKQENQYNIEVPKSISLNDKFGDILDLDIELPSIEEDFPSFNLATNATVEELSFQICNHLPDTFISDCFQNAQAVKQEPAEDINVSDLPASNNFHKGNIENTNDEILEMECDIEESSKPKESTENDKLPPPVPSLFNKSVPRSWPWDESIKFNSDNVRPLMSEREEEYLLQRMEQYKHLLDTAPPTIRRLYRKLAVRKVKRQYGLPILNVDTFGKDVGQKALVKKKGNIVLDRFISEDVSIFFEQRLQGHCDPTSVHSPYTSRLLKPFIRRDMTSRPLWLRVMNELLAKVNRKKPGWKPPHNAPIDYSYIRPQHVPAINSLCTQFFWPGVDLTECLQYPDFTCVVLYKKVVIGFAIMVPDVGYNEAYISFFLVRPEWRKAGIGTFMLYHLIQTCMGKDITLHVSATNPALFLYQKFGFKQEEFVQDFYDKYILPSSKESKHALFLRLSR